MGVSPDITLAVATPDDLDEVIAVYDAVIKTTTGSDIDDVGWDWNWHPTVQQLKDTIARGELLAAVLDGRIVSCLILDKEQGRGYENVPWNVEASPDEVRCIHLFGTLPSMKGQGVGRRFLELVLDYSRSQGAKAVRLDVFDRVKPAQRLYRSVGFTDFGIYPLTYDDPAIAHIKFRVMEYVL